MPSLGTIHLLGGSAVVAVLLAVTTVNADESEQRELPDGQSMKLNIPTWTWGGKQFWTDELIHGEWRIQRHVLSGHYRLLDPHNVRRDWGSWESCTQSWAELREENRVAPLNKRVVIVLHGLGRTRSSMRAMVRYLSENSDCSVLNFSYASTRSKLADDARSLAKVISHLEGVEEIHFVAHSMGNLVVRHFLGDQLAASSGLGVDPRIRRFVMLAPPNNGAALAERLKHNPLFKLVFATGGKEFTTSWEEVQKHLVTPPCEFGIIAGGGTNGEGRNPFLPGDDDLVVSVPETRLPGARDFLVLPLVHSFIMSDAKVQEYTLRFLRHGHFVAEDQRQPVTTEVAGNSEMP